MHPEVGCRIVYGRFCFTVGREIQEIVCQLLTFGTQFPPLLSFTHTLPGYDPKPPSQCNKRAQASAGKPCHMSYKCGPSYPHYVAPQALSTASDRPCLSKTVVRCAVERSRMPMEKRPQAIVIYLRTSSRRASWTCILLSTVRVCPPRTHQSNSSVRTSQEHRYGNLYTPLSPVSLSSTYYEYLTRSVLSIEGRLGSGAHNYSAPKKRRQLGQLLRVLKLERWSKTPREL